MAAAEAVLVAAWYRSAWWLWLLRPLEWLFRALTAVRRMLYRQGVLAVYVPTKPLVIVGNITVGGTGKTPTVLAIIEYLQSRGVRPGLVSRGYGATRTDFPYAVTNDSTAADCGDETLMIFQRTGCACVVAPSRVDAVQSLLQLAQVDVILSDDGLQHYALGRDMEVAVVDYERGLGNGFCLPAGPLREAPSRLNSVDFVLYRGSEDTQNGIRYQPDALVNLVSGEEIPVSADQLGVEVHAVAGIGQPAQFFASLDTHGFSIEEHIFGDHHRFCESDLSALSNKPIIMTEKDAVKCLAIASPNIWYLKISARVPQSLLDAVAAITEQTRE